jgi:predicted CoA-binding protein
MTHADQESTARVLRESKIIAVVGLSADPSKDSWRVAKYLIEQGYTVIPVNPKETEILGQKCYPDLSSIPGAVDVVDVFRRSEAVPPIADEAVRIGAKVLWLQLGVSHEDAVKMARNAGLTVIEDTCIMQEHRMQADL